MSPIQQQRLIGAGLLVLLIALLAYVVLSKVGQHQSQQTLEIPEPIEFSSVIEPLDEDAVAEKIEDDSEVMFDADLQQTITAENSAANTDDEVAPAESEPAQTTPPVAEKTEVDTPAQPVVRPTAPSETPPPEATSTNTDNPTVVAEPNAGNAAGGDRWLIQLGSFSVQSNAQSLKTKLEELGYQPYIENSQTDTGVVYRVRLPATANRAQADDTAARIAKQLGIKAQVITQ